MLALLLQFSIKYSNHSSILLTPMKLPVKLLYFVLRLTRFISSSLEEIVSESVEWPAQYDVKGSVGLDRAARAVVYYLKTL